MGHELGIGVKYPTFFILHHQNKGKPIFSALMNNGWRYQERKPDVSFFDHTLNRGQPDTSRTILKRLYNEGSKIITYPHGATGAWWLDGDMFHPDKHVCCDLVISEGQKHIAEIIDPDTKHEVIGWSLCPQKKFEKPKKLLRILFASIHPPERSEFRPEAKAANTRIDKALSKLTGNHQIIYRHINSLEANGLVNNQRAIYVRGKPDGSYVDIDNADLVIAEGTYMYMAVARGKPVIGINQHLPIRANNSKLRFEPKQWEKYGEYQAYPIDFDDGELVDLIEMAISEEQTEWRSRFIGNQMDEKIFSDLIHKIRYGIEW